MNRLPDDVLDAQVTLVDLAQERAGAQGSELIYRYLATGDPDGPVKEWSYAHVDLRARGLAALLADHHAAGERALLLFPPGLEFVAAFLGCLYAGVIAVPCYPPDLGVLDRSLPRLRAIAADASARFVLTTTAITHMASALANQAPELASLRWLATDDTSASLASAYRRPDLRGHTLAFLQYTSGSTGTPKGVMVTHANILHNERLIALGFGHDRTSSGVGWLPLFHDMGLIGNVLQPLYVGFPLTLMSPLAFLQRPGRWLAAISRYGAVSSGGPNFAYELCVRKVSEAERATLDLSSWSVAFNGAEPVRKRTLERFAEAFAPCGFRGEAFYPCYGLAEATLFVAGGPRLTPPVVLSQAQGDAAARTAQPLVSSGVVAPDMRAIVVDPDSCTPMPQGQVGEIWLAGASVAAGYWNRHEDTRSTFGATLAGTGDGPFLRTGDLGCLRDGRLFVTGRLKDLIILRGQNYYPQDIEQTAEESHASVRAGCVAAFAAEVHGEEQLVTVAEVDVRRSPDDTAAVASAIRAAVAGVHGVHMHAVVLIEPRSIPKTSSGKIQRRACAAAYREDRLHVMERSLARERGDEEPRPDTPYVAPRTPVEEALCGIVKSVLGVERVGVHDDFFALGVQSLLATQVVSRVRDAIAIELPLRTLFEQPTVARLSRVIEARLGTDLASERTEPMTSDHDLEEGEL